MKRHVLMTGAALAIAALAFTAQPQAASIPQITGPQDPSQLSAVINGLINSIVSGTSGVIANTSNSATSTATTAEQNLTSISIPANTLSRAGQSLRLRCAGTTGVNTNSKTVKLYYGTSSISSAAISTAGQNWDLELLVTYAASATQTQFIGRGSTGTTVIAPVATTNSTDDLRTALPARCTTTQGAASAADTTLINFIVEQVK